jgi:hypothetical protein
MPRDDSARGVRERDGRLIAPLIGVYQEGSAALRAQIVQDLAAARFGTAVMRQRQLLVIQTILADLQDRAVPIAAQTATRAYELGAAEAGGDVGARAPMTWGAVHRDAVQIIVDNMVSGLNDAAIMVGRRVEDDYRRFGLWQASQQLIQAKRRRDASAELAQHLVASGTASIVERDGETLATFIDRAGRHWRIETYAEMVARTVVREAHSEGTIAQLADLDYDLVQVSSHVHDRDVCTPYDGRIYSLSGEDPDHPPLVARPPFHPRCVHVLRPGPRSAATSQQQLGHAPGAPA